MKLTNLVLSAALGLSIPGFASADVILTATASPNPIAVGEASTITVTLSDDSGANSVAGFQFDLQFTPTILQVESITEEGYFANNGLTGLTIATINNTAGTITLIADTAATPENPGTGDPLVAIAFSAIDSGSSPITIANAIISDSQLHQIASTEVNTTVIAQASVPEPKSFLLVGISLTLALFGAHLINVFKTS